MSSRISVDPATDTSWITLYGTGKNRSFPLLEPGQHYVCRVCAAGKNGKRSEWST
ncbi:MAG: hypothetical protein RL033_3641, partial [Pseudomonadota bacterium]